MDNCYFEKNVTLKVLLDSKLLNKNIDSNIDEFVINKYTGVLYENVGYIIKIMKVLHKDRVTISQSNCQKIECKVLIRCLLCNPCENTKLLFKIENIDHTSIRLKNGPIIGLVNLAIQYNNIKKIKSYFDKDVLVTNKQLVKIIDDKGESYLKVGDYIACSVAKCGVYNNSFIVELHPLNTFNTDNKKTLEYYNEQYREL